MPEAFAERVERTGADVTENDAHRAQNERDHATVVLVLGGFAGLAQLPFPPLTGRPLFQAPFFFSSATILAVNCSGTGS